MEDDDIAEYKKVKKAKDKKRHRIQTKETEECSKESFKKMREEIDELRKKEQERTEELEELKRTIENRDPKLQKKEHEFALDFNLELYLNRGFIESAQWIKNFLSKSMLEEMAKEEFRQKFESLMIAKKFSTHIGMRSCARFNRGEECNLGRWHTTHKPNSLWTSKHQHHDHDQQQQHPQRYQQQDQSRRNEMRLHVCTLCLETLGAAFGHSVLNCPWILKKNWIINN